MTRSFKLILWAWLLLSLCLSSKAQPTVQVYWDFTNMVGTNAATISRAKLESMPGSNGAYPIINGVYTFPWSSDFTPQNWPSLTNGSLTTNLVPGIQYRFTLTGPFGKLVVTNAFPISLLTNNTPPYNASSYDINAYSGFTNAPFIFLTGVQGGTNVTVQYTNGGTVAIVNSSGGGGSGGGGATIAGTNIVVVSTVSGGVTNYTISIANPFLVPSLSGVPLFSVPTFQSSNTYQIGPLTLTGWTNTNAFNVNAFAVSGVTNLSYSNGVPANVFTKATSQGVFCWPMQFNEVFTNASASWVIKAL